MRHKSTTQIQRLIQGIAKRAGVDLHQPGAYVKVERKPYMPLVIEGLGNSEVAVGHFYVQNGDVIYDPEVVFFTGYEDTPAKLGGGWIPLTIQHPPPCGRHVYGKHDGQELTHLNGRGQRDLATFVNQWTRNLKMQKFGAGEIVDTEPGEVIATLI